MTKNFKPDEVIMIQKKVQLKRDLKELKSAEDINRTFDNEN